MNAVTKQDYIFFTTPTHACSYIDGLMARMVFLDPYYPLSSGDLSHLSRQGFRRSGTFVYKPACVQCSQCLSSRIDVTKFTASTSQKRALKANTDLRIEARPCSHATEVHYALFSRYISVRHRDGDMYPASPQGFDKFIVDSASNSFLLEAWLADKLMGVAVCDPLDDGISAVYTFFEPEADKRSLGTFFILQQILLAQKLNQPYVYLGYWVEGSHKMRYKANFAGLELLMQDEWIPYQK